MAREPDELENDTENEPENNEDEAGSPESSTDDDDAKYRTRRIAELQRELKALEGDEVESVTDDAETAADEIAASGATDAEVVQEADAAAEGIAASLRDNKRITLTDEEIDGIADRITKSVKKKQAETDRRVPPRQRTRDEKPTTRHWSQRRVGGRSRD